MFNYRSVRWCLISALCSIAAVLGVTSASASAAAYGETERFGQSQEFHLNEQTRAFGVDPAENSVWVGDETGTESREYRIRKYSSTGTLEGTVTFKPSYPGGEPAGIEGIAVDQANQRVYVLSLDGRSESAKSDSSLPAAGTLYAFSIAPKEKQLMPAPGTAGGVVATAATLHPESETYGQPLLVPAGITVDPANGDVLILGEVDSPHTVETEGTQHAKHMAIQQVTKTGEAGARYVDPRQKKQVEPDLRSFDSPVVTPGGKVLLVENESEMHEDIVEVPASFASSPPTPVFDLAGTLPGLVDQLPAFETDKAFTEESGFQSGDDLSLVPEGAGARIYGSAEIEADEEVGSAGAVALKYSESSGITEEGWTGAAPGKSKAESCALGFAYEGPGGGEYAPPAVAGGNGDLFMLTYATDEVVKFGAGGSHCPVASAGELEVTVGREPTKKVKVGEEVFFKAHLENTEIKSVEWNFGNGETEKITYPASARTLEVEHEFTKEAKEGVVVTAKIETDNLATPSLTLTYPKVTVSGVAEAEAPEVSTPPIEKETIQEGESVAVIAEEGGSPKPVALWQVSVNNGASWAADTEDQSITIGGSHILEIMNASASKSGYEYRVIFKNEKGEESPPSTPERVTVLAPALPKLGAQPQSVTVIEGEEATFSASATGNPEPVIEWEVSTDGGLTWALEETHGSDFTGKVLKIEKTTAADSGRQYRAVFENDRGEVVSSAATLTVEAAKVTPPPPPGPKSTPSPSSGGGGGGGGSTTSAGTTSVLGTTTTQTPPPAGDGKPYATIASRSLTVTRAGALVVKVGCPTGETTCKGSVTLRLAQSVRTHGKRKTIMLTIASGAFTVAGGQVKTLTLHLSSKGRVLLAHSHGLAARATILASDPTGAKHSTQLAVVLRAAKGKSHH